MWYTVVRRSFSHVFVTSIYGNTISLSLPVGAPCRVKSGAGWSGKMALFRIYLSNNKQSRCSIDYCVGEVIAYVAFVKLSRTAVGLCCLLSRPERIFGGQK